MFFFRVFSKACGSFEAPGRMQVRIVRRRYSRSRRPYATLEHADLVVEALDEAKRDLVLGARARRHATPVPRANSCQLFPASTTAQTLAAHGFPRPYNPLWIHSIGRRAFFLDSGRSAGIGRWLKQARSRAMPGRRSYGPVA